MDGEVGRDRNTTYSPASSSTTPRVGFTTPTTAARDGAALDRRDELAEVHVQHPPRRAPVMSSPAMMTNAWVSGVSRHASSASSTLPRVLCSWAKRQTGPPITPDAIRVAFAGYVPLPALAGSSAKPDLRVNTRIDPF